MTTKQVEIFVAMNEDGDVAVATDADEARDQIDNSFGSLMTRIVKIKVSMSPPVIEEAAVTVPDDAGSTIEAEVEGD